MTQKKFVVAVQVDASTADAVMEAFAKLTVEGRSVMYADIYDVTDSDAEYRVRFSHERGVEEV